jgi:hypothetical protein
VKPRFNIAFLFGLSAVCFLGSFGLGLLLPIFSKLLFDPQFSFSLATSFRPLFLSLLISGFPLFQILSSRVFLFWNKHHSRKVILMWSSFCMGIGFWFSAYSIEMSSYISLLLAISFTGFFAGSKILSPPPISHAKPLGLMLGILVGALSPTPFLFSGFIALFTLIFLGYSLPKKIEIPITTKKSTLLSPLPLLFGWVLTLQFFPIYFLTFFDCVPFMIPFVTTLICLVFLFSKIWIAPFPHSRPFTFALISGMIFFTLLLLLTKVFLFSLALHILIALSVAILLKTLSQEPLIFFIAPIAGGALYCLNIQYVYALIAISFLLSLITSFIRK